WTDAGELAIAHLNTGMESADSNIHFVLNFVDIQSELQLTLDSALAEVRDKGAIGIIGDTSLAATALTRLSYDDDTSNDLEAPMICVTCTGNALNNPDATDADAATQAAYRDVDNW